MVEGGGVPECLKLPSTVLYGVDERAVINRSVIADTGAKTAPSQVEIGTMQARYRYMTRSGAVTIAEHEGQFHVIFEEESLGSYRRPQEASEDVAGGHTFMPTSGLDLGALGIPEDLNEWEKLPPRR